MGPARLFFVVFASIPIAVSFGQEFEPVAARVVSDAAGVVPGEPFRVGVLLSIEPGWHVYWKNPGEVGMPTELGFDLPPGFRAESVDWPLPEASHDSGGQLSYGYADELLLSAWVHSPADLALGDEARLTVRIAWLACEEGCILGEFEESISLPVVEGPAPRETALFDRWAARLPRRVDAEGPPFDAGRPVAVGDRFEVRLRWLGEGTVPVVECFPDPGPAIAVDAVECRSEGDEVIVRYKARRLEGLGSPGVSLPFLVCYSARAGRREGFSVDLYPW